MGITGDGHEAFVLMGLYSAWLAADNPQFVYSQIYTADLFLASPTEGVTQPIGDVRFMMLDLSKWRRHKAGSISKLFALSEYAETLYKVISELDKKQVNQYLQYIDNCVQNVLIIERLEILPSYRHVGVGEYVVEQIIDKMYRDDQLILADYKRQGIKLSETFEGLFSPLPPAPSITKDADMQRNYRESLRESGFYKLTGSTLFMQATGDLKAKMLAEGALIK